MKIQPGQRSIRRFSFLLVGWLFLLFPQIPIAATIWNASDTPIQPADTDGQPLELGVKFQADVDGLITGLRFYKGAANTGVHIGNLWSRTGVLLAGATFTNETASGWQEVQFATPVAIQAGTTYVASYHSSSGYYAIDEGYFGTHAYNPPLLALANGEDGGNGLYKYGASGFPTQTWRASNYWVDVVFNPSTTDDTTPPIVTEFTVQATSTSLTVSITGFTATDNVGVIGYLVNESSTVPSPITGGWAGTAQTSYMFSTAGSKTLYAWAKDAAGNVSAGRNASVTVTAPATTPEPAGWYTGDMHVHRSCGGSPISMDTMYGSMAAQNLSVISLLADMGNGEVLDPITDLPKVNGQDDPISTAGRIVHWDAEWHWDATYFQYPHQALGGHVVALGLTEAHQIWEEYTYPIFEWAHQQNGIAGFAHMQYLDNNIPQTLTSQTLNCCKPIEYPVEVALGSADFISEDVNGSDSFINAYYRLLNTGFRPGFAAGSDFPCNAAVGTLLTYVQVAGGTLTYRNWIEGIAQGRTVISRNGHNEFLNLTVNGNATPGDEINLTGSGSVSVTIEWRANQNLTGTIELVQNGVVVASVQRSVASDAPASLNTTVNFVKSGWLTARRMGSNGHQVHTAAVFVMVDNAPVRASVADAEFYVQWMDNLLAKTSPGGEWNSYFPNNLAEAQSRYQQARAVFQQIAVEAGGGDASPTVVSVSPADGVSGVNPGTAVKAVFSEPMDETTINTTTFELRDAAGILVPAAVGYNGITNTAILTPDVSLAVSTTYTAKVVGGSAGVKDIAGTPLTANHSWSFTTAAQQTSTSHSLWDDSFIPAVLSDPDTIAVELGVKFASSVDGFITALRFYKAAANTGTHVGNLWSVGGNLLASVTFTNETASGWQEMALPTPVAIAAGTTYVASYHTSAGHYSTDPAYFAGSGFANPPLRALADGENGGNGVYLYGAGGFPNRSWNASNYWVDVVFAATQEADTTPPTITATLPDDGAVSVSTTTAVTVTFSETMDETTIDATSFVLLNAVNNPVSATVTYNAAGQTATLTPNAALANTTTYTAKVVGGSAGVKDIAGNPLTSDHIWSFTTESQQTTTSHSLWNDSFVPLVLSDKDTTAVELGVKFESSVDGFIRALRFYKSVANTGTHVGNLWSAGGSLLASVTFTNETASGWQEMALPTPVAIAAGTTYVASYHTNAGRYSTDSAYFAGSGFANPPLRALADGENGGNGVYLYGTGGFPNRTWNASNYWVDVVFEATLGPDITPPTIISTLPAAGAVNVSITTAVTVTFSEAMEQTTINSTTFGLKDASNVPVTASVTYDPATKMATLKPVSPLANSRTYTANVAGGSSGVTDLAGNPLASDHYWSFTTVSAAGGDITPPAILSALPPHSAPAVSTGTSLTVTFNEAMDPASINSSTFELRGPSNALIPASITYDGSKNRAILTPTNSLPASASYQAVIKGAVKDAAGNPLSTDYSWSFKTNASSPYGSGPGGPILVITSSSNPFSRYYAEILWAEGLNAFTVQDISSVSATVLSQYDVAILGEITLTSTQVTMLTNWVNGGGNLIAMRPDKKLAGLMGLTDAGGTLSEGYLLVDPSSKAGAGIVGQTIQFHGSADRYILGSATRLATLYSNSTTATANPAVSLRSVGSNGGQAAAFTYDLARSIVYTRQGNPAWIGQERDGISPIRSDDLFYGNAAGDPQPDWIDLNKIAIPQADEQQRLLANMIIQMNSAKKPLPRFWYFPNGYVAAVIMTGDDHAKDGTKGRFDTEIANSPVNCSLENWECIRSSSYIYPDPVGAVTDSQAAAYDANGFELGIHATTQCANYTADSVETLFREQMKKWYTLYPSLYPQVSHRMHCIAWSGYTALPEEQSKYGIRLDVNYYHWPSGWVANKPGFFTGSGMPMRFATPNGSLIDVYQATTQMTDESGQSYPFTVDSLLDKAIGPEEYYGAFTANMHTDYVTGQNYNAIITSALARGVPVISARQMLNWLDARNGSSFNSLTWNGSVLNFIVSAGQSAVGLVAMVPVLSGYEITSIKQNGNSVDFDISVVKGIEYAAFYASSGTYAVATATNTTPPAVTSHSPLDGAVGVSPSIAVSATFNKTMDAATINNTNFVLRDVSNTQVSATVAYNTLTSTATLTPSEPLAYSATYTAVVRGGAGGVADLSGNTLAADVSWSFATAAQGAVVSTSIWGDTFIPAIPAVADSRAIELGVKFQSEVDGYITGLRFYKGQGNTGTHVGNLWTSTGQLLASVAFVNETASGWQYQEFSTPVAIVSNTTYVASYHTSVGYYSADGAYFAGSGFNSPPLRALANGENGGNGVYLYGAGGFPTQTWNATNYWVDVVFSPAASTSIWEDTFTPAILEAADTKAVELGVKFQSAVDGYITGLRFYKGQGNTGTHRGNLWTSTGQLLASVAFTNETASGWQHQELSTPVAIASNTIYVASYHTSVGRYSADGAYFAGSGFDNSPLRALANGESGGNGVFLYGGGGFPNQTWNASNYWVDVVFSAFQ